MHIAEKHVWKYSHPYNEAQKKTQSKLQGFISDQNDYHLNHYSSMYTIFVDIIRKKYLKPSVPSIEINHTYFFNLTIEHMTYSMTRENAMTT